MFVVLNLRPTLSRLKYNFYKIFTCSSLLELLCLFLKFFFFNLVYLSIKFNFIIILNATGICVLKKAVNLTWSMTFSFVICFFVLLWEWYH